MNNKKKRKISPDKYSKMYFKYYKDLNGRMDLLEERVKKLEEKKK